MVTVNIHEAKTQLSKLVDQAVKGEAFVIAKAGKLLDNPRNELLFSAASLWEIAIKNTLGREDFRVEPRLLRRGLLDNGYAELPVTSQHAVSIDGLPALHKDPFDRLLLAQALAEGITLLTGDAQLARYPGPVHKL